MFRLIDGIGPALWRAATGVPFEELVGAAETAYGRPDGIDIVAAVKAAVGVLSDQNVLMGMPAEGIPEDIDVTAAAEHPSGESIWALPSARPAG